MINTINDFSRYLHDLSIFLFLIGQDSVEKTTNLNDEGRHAFVVDWERVSSVLPTRLKYALSNTLCVLPGIA